MNWATRCRWRTAKTYQCVMAPSHGVEWIDLKDQPLLHCVPRGRARPFVQQSPRLIRASGIAASFLRGTSVRTTTYSIGINSRFRTCRGDHPPKHRGAYGHAPCGARAFAITSGTTPRMKASEVIRIGRSRMRAASTGGIQGRQSLLLNCSANSTIRMAFLLAKPISITSPIWQ